MPPLVLLEELELLLELDVELEVDDEFELLDELELDDELDDEPVPLQLAACGFTPDTCMLSMFANPPLVVACKRIR